MKKDMEFKKFVKNFAKEPKVKWGLAAVMLLSSLLYGAALLHPLILRFLVDEIIPTEQTSHLGIWLGVAIGAVIATSAFSAFAANYLYQKIEFLLTAAVNKRLVRKVLSMKSYNFKGHSTGKLLNIISEEAHDGINIIFQYVTSLFTSILVVVVIALVVFGISPMVIVVLVLASPFYVLALFINNKKLEKTQRDMAEWGDKAASMRRYLLEYKESINTAKMDGIFTKENDARIDRSTRNIIRYWFWAITSREMPSMVLGITRQVVTFVAAISVIGGNMTLGTMLMLISYVEIFMSALQVIAHGNVRKNANTITYERLNEILHTEEVKDNFNEYVHFDKGETFVDISSVEIASPTGEKLLGIPKLLIDKPGLYQLVGANGTGKSTILRLLTNLNHSSGILPQSNGHVRINGKMVAEAAYCTAPYAFATASVYDNILLGKKEPDHYNEVLDILKIDFLQKEIDPDDLSLSLGERGKVVLARTLMQDSKVLILDEPLANIDMESAERIAAYLKVLAKEKIIIVVSHDEIFAQARSGLLTIADNILSVA